MWLMVCNGVTFHVGTSQALIITVGETKEVCIHHRYRFSGSVACGTKGTLRDFCGVSGDHCGPQPKKKHQSLQAATVCYSTTICGLYNPAVFHRRTLPKHQQISFGKLDLRYGQLVSTKSINMANFLCKLSLQTLGTRNHILLNNPRYGLYCHCKSP